MLLFGYLAIRLYCNQQTFSPLDLNHEQIEMYDQLCINQLEHMEASILKKSLRTRVLASNPL